EIPTAISDPKQDNNILKIYPNPVRDRLNIQLSIPQTALIEIYNYAGIIVMVKTINGSESIDVSALPNGIYLIRSTTLQKSERTLFIKN
ncbi:MAG: T9SS C-terminal target domain-containing protein, partial [Dehalococcoidia bacterium]